jgi:hypothetical protein
MAAKKDHKVIRPIECCLDEMEVTPMERLKPSDQDR